MKKHRVLACILAIILVFSGCAPAPAEPVETEASAAAQQNDTLIDCAGREVQIPEQTDKIACLYAYTGHVCVLLGCEDQIVAVVNGLKRDQLMQRKIPGIMDMSCPYGSGSINIEELAAVAPNMVFLRVENLVDSGEVEKLESIDVPYVVVDYTTMEQQIYSIEVMGKALRREEKANAYLDYYQATIDMVRERIAQVPDSERKTVYHSVNEVVRTDIPQTLSYEILEAAGCINVVQSSGELRLDGDKGMVTVEQIYVWDPDVVLVNEPDAKAYFETDEKFTGLRAVREGNVYQLPVGISRWGHPGSLESPLAALYIAKLLYPEYFADIDIAQEIQTFYESFFAILLTQEDIAMIISGQGMRTPREGENQP